MLQWGSNQPYRTSSILLTSACIVTRLAGRLEFWGPASLGRWGWQRQPCWAPGGWGVGNTGEPQRWARETVLTNHCWSNSAQGLHTSRRWSSYYLQCGSSQSSQVRRMIYSIRVKLRNGECKVKCLNRKESEMQDGDRQAKKMTKKEASVTNLQICHTVTISIVFFLRL